MLFKRETLPLWGAAAVCLAVASYGFWGGRFTALPLAALEEIAAETDVRDPVPSFRPDLSGWNGEEETVLAGRKWGDSPFLTASEEGRYGAEHRSVGAVRRAAAAGGVGESALPEARALIRAGSGKPVVLLGGGAARIGQEAGGVRIVDVDGRRVLVEGKNGREWIEVVPSDRRVKVNGADR